MRNRAPFLIVIAAAIAILFIFSIQGCAPGFMNTAHSSLETSAITVDAAMKTCAMLYDNHYITEADVAKIKALHRKYRMTYMIAVDTLALYERNKDIKGYEEEFAKTLNESLALAARISLLLNDFLVRKNE